MENTAALKPNRPTLGFLHSLEDIIFSMFFVILTVIPVVEVILRVFFKSGIPSGSDYIEHLVLVVTFLGGMITSREKEHLGINAAIHSLKGTPEKIVRTGVQFISAGIMTAFAWSSLSLQVTGYSPTEMVGIIPMQIIVAVMPAGFFAMSLRSIALAPKGIVPRLVVITGILFGTFIGLPTIGNFIGTFSSGASAVISGMLPAWTAAVNLLYLPLIIFLVIAGIFGLPLFAVLGGIAYILFAHSGGSLEVVANQAYTMLTHGTIPAIALFTLAGFLLSESKAGERLVRLLMAVMGWMPGGLVIATVMAMTLFTTFTGASDVTILSLGGVLWVILAKSGKYKDSFNSGLLTGSGMIGQMFPPSLAVILYSTIAGVSVLKMFIGALLPGILLVLGVTIAGVVLARMNLRKDGEKHDITPFNIREALSAIKGTIGELLLPVFIIAGYFSGLMTIVETGAFAAVYTFVLETIIHRELNLKGLHRAVIKSASIIGAVLIVLGLSYALTYFIVDANIPVQLTDFLKTHIHSKYLFLLLMNITLLIAGCVMGMFSAIMVLVPLIIPVGLAFGVHPVHLGVIFLFNLEIGFLIPPVGLNLFMASSRFERPVVKIYRDILPFLAVQLVLLLIITYVPWFSTVLLGSK
ncbi:MAG: TRAP transporter large permease subunit [Spirochaetes bacterium]|nr:TRAP transporter large permease subunit [Spirochaetota bacterium]